MASLPIQNNEGASIRSFNDWATYALPPQRKKLHWKQGRSAWELGRIWTEGGEPGVPRQLAQLLESHEGTRRIVILSGITERETPLPFGDRGPRCHDLALVAEQGGHLVTICIEGKADESFGGTVAQELRRAKKRAAERQGGQTRFPERLDWLTHSLLGRRAFEDGQLRVPAEVVADLPYQLLPAIAGTLLEAEDRKASRAVFVVHEFRTKKTNDANLDANADALNRFLRIFLSANGASIGGNFELRCGQLVGPISVTDRHVGGTRKVPRAISLFVGKIRTDLVHAKNLRGV
jgi:hypothetical protein